MSKKRIGRVSVGGRALASVSLDMIEGGCGMLADFSRYRTGWKGDLGDMEEKEMGGCGAMVAKTF